MARSSSSPAVMSDTSGTGLAEVSRRPLALSLLLSLRPGQWTKNLLVFAGLLFGKRLTDPTDILRAGTAFAVFCLLSGVVYLINDVADRESDRKHPLKAKRPIASGAVSVPLALGTAFVLGATALGAAYALGGTFLTIAGLYLALLAAYSG